MPELSTWALAHLTGEAFSRLRSERGQTIAEYGLMVSIVAVFIMIVALIAFREEIIDGFNLATNCFQGSC
jgi:Flp pilus assembly pilin Flp